VRSEQRKGTKGIGKNERESIVKPENRREKSKGERQKEDGKDL